MAAVRGNELEQGVTTQTINVYTVQWRIQGGGGGTRPLPPQKKNWINYVFFYPIIYQNAWK